MPSGKDQKQGLLGGFPPSSLLFMFRKLVQTELVRQAFHADSFYTGCYLYLLVLWLTA